MLSASLGAEYVAATEAALATALVQSRDKSGNPCKQGCPNPVRGWAAQSADGEWHPLRCRSNQCAYCRRQNAMVTAAMFGLDASMGNAPVLALMTSTREWVPDFVLRETTAQFVRKVRARVTPNFEYAWEREWTTGRSKTSGGIRRTHYHWLLKNIDREAEPALLAIATEVYRRKTGAWRHHVQPVWDAAGMGRYIAGLVGHHLKAAQQAPPGWRGRRVGTSRAYYTEAASELRMRAELWVREDKLLVRLERETFDALTDGEWLPEELYNAELEHRYVQAIRRPAATVVQVPADYWERQRAA